MTIITERLTELDKRFTTAESFWNRVDKSDDCWVWAARTDKNGYGRVGYRRHSNVGAHRVAWALSHGGDLPELWVLHRCDNPPCVNPEHLFLGDSTANNRDRQAKGRTGGWASLPGTQHHNFVVTEEIAEEMRVMRKRRASQRQIAEVFGVSRGHVSKIVTGVLPRYTRGGF